MPYNSRYYQDNKDRILERNKQYYVANKEAIAEANRERAREYYNRHSNAINLSRREKTVCPTCACVISKNGISRHKKSSKHIRALDG